MLYPKLKRQIIYQDILNKKITKTNTRDYTMAQTKYIINKLNKYNIDEEKN